MQVEDSIREYSKKGNGKYISSYNEYEDEKNEKKFDYLNDWIENDRKIVRKGTQNNRERKCVIVPFRNGNNI